MIRELRRKLYPLKALVLRELPLLRPRFTKLFHGLPTVPLPVLVPESVVLDPPILDDICMPPYFERDDHDDILPLLQIAKFLQPHIVVELGTAHGNSTANVCRQCPTAKVYTVNAPVEQTTGDIITFKLTHNEIGRVYRAHGLAGNVVQIFKNTLELDLSEYFTQPIIDLAIIDACHDTEYVINDFSKIQPFVSPQGVVLFHDTHPSLEQHLRGSYEACMQLRRKGYDVRHIQHTWWGIWINGKSGRLTPRRNGT